MSHRFLSKPDTVSFRNMILSLVIFLVILSAVLAGFSSMQQKIDQDGLTTLQNAVTRCITRCYAEEGFYPESLSYLQEHYGLYYDETRYFIDYQPLGANIMPDVTVLPRGGSL